MKIYLNVFILDEKPDVDYADIGGLDLQKQEIREAVELPLTHYGKYEKTKFFVFISFSKKNCIN